MNLKERVNSIYPELVELRRSIHEEPEVGMDTVKTKDKIVALLKEKNIQYRTTSKNGIIVDIKGTKEESNQVVLLRADMDALCLQENTDLPYASKEDGKMHACGHDLHSSMLVGTAIILNDLKDTFSGTIRCIWQPGEETSQGATHMIEEGVMDNVKMGFGMHVDPLSPTGTLSAKRGADWAAVDHFEICVKGIGAHGATPQKGKDAIVAASALVLNLQTLVSRECDPMKPLVITVGQFHGGSSYNIIANEVYLEGTCRSFDEEVYDALPSALDRVVKNTAQAYGCEATINLDRVAKAVINDDEAFDVLEITANKVLDAENFQKAEPAMIGEDFSEYGQIAPCVFTHLGCDGGYPLHSCYVNFKEEAMLTGIEIEIQFGLDALEYLTKKV